MPVDNKGYLVSQIAVFCNSKLLTMFVYKVAAVHFYKQ